MQLLVEDFFLAKKEGYRIIIAGDFNNDYDQLMKSEEGAYMLLENMYKSNNKNTFMKRKNQIRNREIDFIFSDTLHSDVRIEKIE